MDFKEYADRCLYCQSLEDLEDDKPCKCGNKESDMHDKTVTGEGICRYFKWFDKEA